MKLTLLLLVAVAGRAAIVEADSARGARLFETLSCVQCHGVNGKGGTVGPDLGRVVNREFTPARLAATMWNHAPEMWASMRQKNIAIGELDEQGAADLFAFFASSRYFEKAGDAGRGKEIFTRRGCEGCHGVSATSRGIKPVDKWDGVNEPMALVEAMWNHAPRMMEATGARKVSWPVLSGQDLADLQVYLRNLPALRGKTGVYRIGAGANGEATFKSSGCPACHKGGAGPLVSKIRRWTLSDVSAAMWNHAPRMKAAGAKPSRLEPGEMHELISFLWARQFFGESGDAARGKRFFTAKRCSNCHEDASSGAPRLPSGAGQFNAALMVSTLWRHGPGMNEQMKIRSIAWPRFEGTEMADIIAFLNAGKPGK